MRRGPSRPFHPRWTPERDEALKRLVAAGKSSSQIAALSGISRNSVIGRIHRLKLTLARRKGSSNPRAPQAPKPPADKPRRAPRRKLIAGVEQIVLSQKPVAPRTSVPAVIPTFVDRDSYFLPLADTPPVDLMGLQGGRCRWPVNGLYGRDPIYCGRHADGTYCRVHHRIAYQPASSLKEKRHGANT
ncbi:hypothetical protein NKL07_22010 [Mesorhizobium sp. C280B]|uniref:GcrA family cell cycle regulator n=1 Tax=unclassified Mesorhizobium TaxID=325217 RepID=UPI0003CEF0A0|nr:GcrA family cell cycle regulator [Mesorhizobium sp. LSJC280B00]ESW92673.1 GcrA cell cycle regulator [Mesorhizobium sp. LSJC280B00]